MQKISLILLGIILGVCGLEIFIRIFDFAPQVQITNHERYRLSQNTKIVYEPINNFKYGMDVSNELGYRGKLYPLHRSDSNYRIVIIGDSVSEGLLISDYAAVYPYILEENLKRSKINAEVINFGVNGYNTSQEVETLKDKGMQYKPDLIILQYALNDNYGDDGGLAYEVFEKAKNQTYIEKIWAYPVLLHSAIYRFIKFHFYRDIREKYLNQYISGLSYSRGNTVEESFSLLKYVASDTCVLVAIFPWFDKGLSNYPYITHHDKVKSFAANNQFNVIDLLPAFQSCEATKKAKLNFDHVHPNHEGHSCAANAISEHIIKTGLDKRCRFQ